MAVKKVIVSLQTMRLFASLGVVQYHLWHNYFGVTVCHPGTDFFLILVGMISALNLAGQIPSGNLWGYIRARYIRLYVTYIPLFILTLVIKWPEAACDWVLQSFLFIPTADRLPVIGATWMLSMFILFYFIFALAFLARTEVILWPIFAVWSVGVVSFNWLGWEPGLPVQWSNLFFNERNLDFIFGYVAGVILREGKLPQTFGRPLMWIGLVTVITGTTLLNLGFNSVNRTLLLGLPVTLFVLGLAYLEMHGIPDQLVRVLTWPSLVWLGGASYALYLSHGIYLRIWSSILPVAMSLIPIITLGAVLVAAVGYLCWEKPLLGYLKKSGNL